MKYSAQSKHDFLYFSCLVLFFLQFVLVGYWGLDFGYHWDEKPKILIPLINSFESGSIFPGSYYYPSFLHELLSLYLFTKSLFGPLFLDRPEFLLEMRFLTLLMTGISIFFVAILIRWWRKSRFEALCAAAFMASSWEVGYHSRWLTVDGLFMTMGTATMMVLIRSFSTALGFRWLALSSFLAGLVMGTKYPGGLILLPVLLVRVYHWNRDTVKNNIFDLVHLIGIFVIAFFISTPGALFQSDIFKDHIIRQYHVYSTGHAGYTVAAGFEHLSKMAAYLFFVAPSKYLALSVVVGLLCLVGIFDMLKRESQHAVLFLSFPIAYFLYFGFHRVMIVRNILILIPFGMILAARGFTCLLEGISRKSARLVTGGVLLSGYFFANSFWLIKAADTIHFRNESDLKAVADVSGADKTKTKTVLLSSGIQSRIRANEPFTFEKVFGPQEVNLNYYPTWKANDHIVVMKGKKAAGSAAY